MKNVFKLFALALAAVMLFSAAALADTLSDIQEKGQIVFATEGDWAPWTYFDEDGELKGFDVEVGRAVAEKLGVEAVFEATAWESILGGIGTRYDSAVNSIDITEDRQAVLDFSTPYFYNHTVLIVRGDNEDITSFEDLNGRTTANSIGSTYMEMGEKMGATVTGVETLEDTLNMVLSGRVDATINAELSFYDYMEEHPDANLKVVAISDDATEVAIPVAKGEENASLLDALNGAVLALHEDGTLTEISVKYFGKDYTKLSAQETEE